MKTIFSAATIASLFAGSALAGGFAAPVVEVVPVVEPRTDVDWTGFYAGLQYGQGDAEVSGYRLSTEADFDGVGLHVGYLRDLGQFVLGGELGYNNLSNDEVDESSDFWSLRARVGYDMGKFQPYVTLGAARYSEEGITETGVIYGIGAEFLVANNFSVGLEYSHAEFSDIPLNGFDLDFDVDLVQLRASYRF